MKKKVLKQLRQFEQMLPQTTSSANVYATGKELLEIRPDLKDSSGKPIDPNKSYLVPGYVRNNHYRTMKKIYKKKGEEGLKEFAKMMGDFENGRITMVEEAIGGISERAQSIRAGF